MKETARYQGVEKHSSGFKLLAAMGWKEGEGLVRAASRSTLTVGHCCMAVCSSRARAVTVLSCLPSRELSSRAGGST